MKITKQNPLSIIALFAGLAEVAGTVMITYLSEKLQSIFIWFVMVFPILLILLFFFVLYKKPLHFYSPEYYKNENNFVAAMLENQKQEIMSIYESVVEESDVPDEVKDKLENKIVQIEKKYESIKKEQNIEDNILSIKIDRNVIEGSTVKNFYRKVFNYLKENNINYESLIPYNTGTKRYLINDTNKHINGKDFFLPLEFDKYFIETHKSKIGARKDIIKFLEALNLDVE